MKDKQESKATDSTTPQPPFEKGGESGYGEALELYNDYCEEHKLNAGLPYESPAGDDQENTNAYHMMKKIIKNENGGKTPDALDRNQYKYYPYFYIGVSGSGLSCIDCVVWSARTGVPARLCSFDSEKAGSIVRRFMAIYNILQK